MRTAQSLIELLRWRWAPFAGLVSASVLYVAVVAVAVPDHIDFARTPRSRSALNETPAGQNDTGSESNAAPPIPPVRNASSTATPAAENFGPRGFSPIEHTDAPTPDTPPVPPTPPTPEPQAATPTPAPPPQPPSEPDDNPPPALTAQLAPQEGAAPSAPRVGPFQRLPSGRQVQQIAAAIARDGGGGSAPAPPPPAVH